MVEAGRVESTVKAIQAKQDAMQTCKVCTTWASISSQQEVARHSNKADAGPQTTSVTPAQVPDLKGERLLCGHSGQMGWVPSASMQGCWHHRGWHHTAPGHVFVGHHTGDDMPLIPHQSMVGGASLKYWVGMLPFGVQARNKFNCSCSKPDSLCRNCYPSECSSYDIDKHDASSHGHEAHLPKHNY